MPKVVEQMLFTLINEVNYPTEYKCIPGEQKHKGVVIHLLSTTRTRMCEIFIVTLYCSK